MALMHFYIEIETEHGWRYLRRGCWDAVKAYAEVSLIPLGSNTTESLGDAEMWMRRGILTSRGPCSFDIVKWVVAREFPLREVAVRRGEIHSVTAPTYPPK